MDIPDDLSHSLQVRAWYHTSTVYSQTHCNYSHSQCDISNIAKNEMQIVVSYPNSESTPHRRTKAKQYTAHK